MSGLARNLGDGAFWGNDFSEPCFDSPLDLLRDLDLLFRCPDPVEPVESLEPLDRLESLEPLDRFESREPGADRLVDLACSFLRNLLTSLAGPLENLDSLPFT